MDLTTLRAVLWDLRGRLLPSRFEKAQQPDPATLQLGFRCLKGMIWLELSWQAEAPRLIQIPPPPRIGAGSTLSKQLQHGLRQLALVELHQDGFERVVEFRLATRPGEPVKRVLVLELMGRHSNLMLLDEQRRVIALGRQVRSHQSRVRPISTGDDYTPPPPLQGLPPQRQDSFDRWQTRLRLLPLQLRKALQQTYQGISPALAEQLAGSWLDQTVEELSDEQWRRLHKQWCLWLDQLESGPFLLVIEDGDKGRYRVWGETDLQTLGKGTPLALALGSLHQRQLDHKALHRAVEELRQRLQRWRDKEESALTDQRNRLAASHGHDALQRQADALLCLRNPRREDVDQAQKLYRRARKLRRAGVILQERIEHHMGRLALINGSESFVDDQLAASWQPCRPRLTALNDLSLELEELLQPREQQRLRRRGEQKQPQPQPMELITPSGLKVQVGRNHRQNDWVSLRQARSGDLWFHAQECPGSHIVLKSSNGMADDADLQRATDLAAYFSRARGNSRVAVVMVPTDQLQRIPGAGPGTVRHGPAEVRWGDPQRAVNHLRAPSLQDESG